MDSRKVVFLDRDGVINRAAPPHQYIVDWDEFHILPGVYEAIRKCNQSGYYVVVISNQRGIARGLCSRRQVDELNEKMVKELKSKDAEIHKVYICPHDNGECSCRKPNPGMFYMAEEELWKERKEKVDKIHSWMIGDSASDVEAGRAYGVKTIWIQSSDKISSVNADYTAKSLYEAVRFVCAKNSTEMR